MDWKPHKGTVADDMIAWLYAEFFPIILSNPNFFSAAVYRTKHMTVMENGVTQEMDVVDDYTAFFETTHVETPWEALVELGQTEGWETFMEQGSVHTSCPPFFCTSTDRWHRNGKSPSAGF